MKGTLLIDSNIQANNFDFIRFLLATAVIFCHCYAIYYGYDKFLMYEPFMKWSRQQISIGSVAVNGFFIISGFLIVKSWERSGNFRQYLKKRILRIYPGFLVAFALSFLVFGPLGHMETYSYENYWAFIQSVPLKREWLNMWSLQAPLEHRYFTNLPQSGLNNSLWTIQYEFVCYLVLPLLAWLGCFKDKRWLLASFLLCYLGLGLQSFGYVFSFDQSLSGWFISNPYYYPRFFVYFLSGAVVYSYRYWVIRSNSLAWIATALIVIAFRFQLVEVLLPIALTYLIFFFAYHPKIQWHHFGRAGDFSYGIYLYGWPLQQLIMLYWWPYLNPVLFFLAVMPLIGFWAYLSWRFVERPVLKWKNKPILRHFNRLAITK